MPNPKLSLSVKVIVRNPNGEILLLRRSRKSRSNPGKWEFPGGKVEAGEGFDTALKRAIREETGLPVQIGGPFDTCESRLADRRIVYLVMEATTKRNNVWLGPDHDKEQWAHPSDFADVDLAPQFRRVAVRYAADVAANPRPGDKPEPQTPKDPHANSIVNPDNLDVYLDHFSIRQEKLGKLKSYLEELLNKEVQARVPLADVSVRTKNPVSFAGKLIRKDKYRDPLTDVTDLVGARVIVHLQSEVTAVCEWIEQTFEVDRANSGDKLKDLGAEKFGYRSVHYVVEMMAGKPKGASKELEGMKAEIQVRTIAQHAWSDIGHDRVYKAGCEIPDYWKRQSNRISALLEAADEEFERLVKGLAAYESYKCHFAPEEGKRLIALWDVVRCKLPEHPLPALHVARIALDLEDWGRVITVVREFGNEPTADLLAAMGYAKCKKSKPNRTGTWAEGVRDLEKAAAMAGDNLEPLLRLGELHATEDMLEESLVYYAQAFAVDPSHPEALVGYVRGMVLTERSTAFIPLLRPDIERAIHRSEELAAAEGDMPWCLYRIAGFLLLLGPEHGNKSLSTLAHAVHCTSPDAPAPLLQTLRDISDLAEFEPKRSDIECARRFLTAALMAKFPDTPWPDDVKKPAMKRLATRKKPVVIVAGSCSAYHDAAMRRYSPLLKKAFATFDGTVVSGGTTEGISGVVGKLAAESGGRIHAIGYLPKNLPDDGTATKDEDRYEDLRRTNRADRQFTALEPIQSWLDLLHSGIKACDVCLLGINGGNIAGLEYRLAVSLGAIVGVIEGSGREAERVANDWPANERPESCGRFMILPPDAMTLRAFISLGTGTGTGGPLPAVAVEQAAELAHQQFLDEQRYRHPDPVMQSWSKLRDDLQESNRSQITYLVEILRAEGFRVQPIQGDSPADPKFTKAEVHRMGEMEHGRWNVERLGSGWKYASTKNALKKETPYIVSWKPLPPEIKKYDYQNVRAWCPILAELGYEIIREPK